MTNRASQADAVSLIIRQGLVLVLTGEASGPLGALTTWLPLRQAATLDPMIA